MVQATIQPASNGAKALPGKPGTLRGVLHGVLAGITGRAAAKTGERADNRNLAARPTGKKAEGPEKDRSGKETSGGELLQSALTFRDILQELSKLTGPQKTMRGAGLISVAAGAGTAGVGSGIPGAGKTGTGKIISQTQEKESSTGKEDKTSKHELRMAAFRRKPAPGDPDKADRAQKQSKQRETGETGELKPASPKDSGKEESREIPEIRVSVRGGADRFSESLRAADGRSVRETAAGLLRQMREDGNEKIVRSARIVLKDSREGEIRLILKPERLGEVRIRLHLQDNLIGGRILVENTNVREIFQQNMTELASAFRESGFELGNLDVSVGNKGTGGGEGENEFPRFAAGIKTAELERSVPSVGASLYYASHAVNFMA